MRAFRDERGFTTLGMACALLVTLTLLFTTAQVYRLDSQASQTQYVADACALAAQNQVGEFMVLVHVCDAVALSMTLTSLAATGLGTAASCVPAAAAVGKGLLKAGRQVAAARTRFARSAAKALNKLQRALPYLAAVSAAAVAAENSQGSDAFVALTVLAPGEGEEISVWEASEVDEVQDAADEQVDELQDAAEEAEEAAEQANAAKERAFQADCGADPDYCMYERAAKLAGMQGAENPRYSSVDTWSFSVALERAQAYYARRLAQEEPQGSSVEEQARSALRAVFYAYAVEQLEQGYVVETDEDFDAYFPTLPRNTSQMRETTLYTDAAYPVSTDEDGQRVMHAWDGCPGIEGAVTWGSIKQMEEGGYATCAECAFKASSLGKVASASTNISNGFEYHYLIVAEAAEDYEKALEEAQPATERVKEEAQGLFDQVADALQAAAGARIEAQPPGSTGVVVILANVGSSSPSEGFESGFVQATGTLGARVAVSAATLQADPADGEDSIVCELLESVADQAGVGTGAAGVVADVWSDLLVGYAQGQEALTGAVRRALGRIPLVSASGLGSWAAKALEEAVSTTGLQAPDLDAYKAVLVNSGEVAQADDGAFFAELLSLKRQAVVASGVTSDAWATLAANLGIETDEDAQASLQVARVQLYDGGPTVSIDVALPEAAADAAETWVDDAAEALGSIAAGFTELVVWE